MPRTIRAPRGVQLTCKNWLIEAAYRMLQNDLGEVDSQSTPLQFLRERAIIVRKIRSRNADYDHPDSHLG